MPKDRIELSADPYQGPVFPLNYIGIYWCLGRDSNPYHLRRREIFYPIKLPKQKKSYVSTQVVPNLLANSSHKASFAFPLTIILSSSPSILKSSSVSILS